MPPLHTASIDPCRPLSTHTHTLTGLMISACSQSQTSVCSPAGTSDNKHVVQKHEAFSFFFFFLMCIAAPSLTGSFSASSQPGKIFLQHVLSRKLQFSNIPVHLFAEQSCSSVRGTVPNSVVQFFLMILTL